MNWRPSRGSKHFIKDQVSEQFLNKLSVYILRFLLWSYIIHELFKLNSKYIAKYQMFRESVCNNRELILGLVN